MEQNLCKDNFHHNSSQLIKQKIIGMILQNWKNVALKITSNLLLGFYSFDKIDRIWSLSSVSREVSREVLKNKNPILISTRFLHGLWRIFFAQIHSPSNQKQ